MREDPTAPARGETQLTKKTTHNAARDRTQAAKERLRAAGLRGTPARIGTLLVIEESDSPLTHAEVAEKLEALGADKATVLRNLTDLVEVGLARRTEVGDRLWRYEATTPETRDECHPHFLCVDCGTVTCLEDVELSAGSHKQSQQVGRVTEILLKGHCNSCHEANDP
jgi:Fur family ferric uptake transcriptional regulator